MYRPGDHFIEGVMTDLNCFGHAFIECTDDKYEFRARRIPPSVILGGYYYA